MRNDLDDCVCSITKQYVAGSCPDTRANNYAVSSLNIVNKCSDEITSVTTAVCNNVFNKGAQTLPALLSSAHLSACMHACTLATTAICNSVFNEGAPPPAVWWFLTERPSCYVRSSRLERNWEEGTMVL